MSVCSLRCRTNVKVSSSYVTTGFILLINWKNPIIKPHRKISKEPAANYSSGFWHHSSPTLLCVSLFCFLGLMSVKITKTYMKNCSTIFFLEVHRTCIKTNSCRPFLYKWKLRESAWCLARSDDLGISFQYPEPSLNQYELRKYLKVNKKVIDCTHLPLTETVIFLFCLRKWEEEWERPFKGDV